MIRQGIRSALLVLGLTLGLAAEQLWANGVGIALVSLVAFTSDEFIGMEK